MNELDEIIGNVKSKEDFIRFMGALIKDFRTNIDDWENRNLCDYLEAIQNWVEDMDGCYVNNNRPIPQNVSWQVLSEILIAASMYE